MKKIKILVDMDGTLFDYNKAHKESVLKKPENQYPQSEIKFFENLEPIPDAIETYKWLSQYFEMFILTRPSIKNPLCYLEKRLSIEKHLGMDAVENLIYSCDKTMVKGDYLIDDWDQSGIYTPEWSHIKIGSTSYPNWNSIKEYFKKLLYEQL